MKRVVTSWFTTHHSLSADVSANEINEWHIARGFDGIGYHAVIHPDGALEYGRDLCAVGAHNKWHNWNSVGVCLTGNFNLYEPTPAALASAAMFYIDVCKVFKKILGINYHREGDNPCPGKLFDREEYLEILIREATYDLPRSMWVDHWHGFG